MGVDENRNQKEVLLKNRDCKNRKGEKKMKFWLLAFAVLVVSFLLLLEFFPNTLVSMS